MKCKQILIIPDTHMLPAYTALAGQRNLGFEYNDFFLPKILDDEETRRNLIRRYQQDADMPAYCTMHGAFLDITVFSDDPLIAEASDKRVEQSLQIASALGVKGVVFHTNYIANFKTASYRRNYVKANIAYWGEKLDRYSELDIYIENMFDDTPELLAELAEGLNRYDNFGVCFDYAHAHVFGNPAEIEDWVISLAPYVKHLHINDNHFLEDEHLAVGDGAINWQMFKTSYEKYFPEASVLIEVNGMDKIQRSLEFLDKL